jgi:hypothetical protein
MLAVVMIQGVAAAAQVPPDYSGFTAARFIPFVAPMSSVNGPYHPPELRFAIRGRKYTAVMDTGSTGVMLSATGIPGYTPSTACQDPSSFPGWEFLSSSKRLWVGHWISEEIHFLDSQGGTVIATVPVLAVECEAVCPQFHEGALQPLCPGTPLHPASPGIHYMGVGFGREHDGQPQGTPDKNPLLNITSIAGKPVAPGSMRSGYVLTAQGVHVGLTLKNTSGFAYTKLTCPNPPGDTRDCSQAPICVMVDGSGCASGSVLVDTGIAQMYLSVPPSVPVRAQAVPDPSNKTLQICALQNGSRVTVRFGAPSPIAFYSFAVGQSPAQPTQPPLVLLPQSTGGMPPACTPPSSAQGRSSFVNTGGNFLQGFDVLFDAGGGYFGLRWKGPAGSPQGGLGPGLQISHQE